MRKISGPIRWRRGRRIKDSRVSREVTAVSDIHDGAAELEELVRGNRLSEEVGGIIISFDERHDDFLRLDHVTNIKVTPLDMLCAVMKFWIVREIVRTLVVSSHGSRLGDITGADSGKFLPIMHSVLGAFR